MSIWHRLFGSQASVGKLTAGPDSSGSDQPLHRAGYKNPEELAAYITAELERCVPQGWSVNRGDYWHTLSWIIKNEHPGPREWADQEYDLWVTHDLELLVITHDNCDVGPGPLYEHAVVIHTRLLRSRAALPQALQYVMSKCRPNEWGYT